MFIYYICFVFLLLLLLLLVGRIALACRFGSYSPAHRLYIYI